MKLRLGLLVCCGFLLGTAACTKGETAKAEEPVKAATATGTPADTKEATARDQAGQAMKADATPAAVDLKAALGGLEGLSFDASSSKLGFVGAKVTSSHEGGFHRFEGRLGLDRHMLKSVAVAIDMGSTWADHPKLERHLKSEDFFSVEEHPVARFVSSSIDEGGDAKLTHFIKGKLTLRGVTKDVAFPVALNASPERFKVEAEFTINRQDFGIRYPGAPDNLIRDDVTIKLDVVVPRPPEGK